jgi:hypothetical protein
MLSRGKGIKKTVKASLFRGISSSGSRCSQLLCQMQPRSSSRVRYHMYTNFISNLFIYLTTYIILQEDSESVEDQGR